MKLTVSDRFAILGLLPQKGDITTLRIVREITKAVELSDSQQKHIGLRQSPDVPGRVLWDPEKAKDIEIDVRFGEAQHGLIVQQLRELDSKKELPLDHVDLYDGFVLGRSDEESEDQKAA